MAKKGFTLVLKYTVDADRMEQMVEAIRRAVAVKGVAEFQNILCDAADDLCFDFDFEDDLFIEAEILLNNQVLDLREQYQDHVKQLDKELLDQN